MKALSFNNMLTVREAAAAIGCTVGRIRQLLGSGDLKGCKFNERAWMVNRESVQEFAKKPRKTGRPRVSA